MKIYINEHDVAIRYISKFREFGLPILDGGTSIQLIDYCPWCGCKLPTSLRDEWFDIVYDDLELDDPEDPRLPDSMKSDDWWKKRSE